MENKKSLNVMKCVLVKEAQLEYATKDLVSETIVDVLKEYGLDTSADEKMVIVCLDIHMNIIGLHEVAHDSIDGCGLRMADIYKRALLNNAYSIVIAHNHPSGDVTPSSTDITFTERVIKAGDILGISCLDHIIVSMGNHYCLREHRDWCFD